MCDADMLALSWSVGLPEKVWAKRNMSHIPLSPHLFNKVNNEKSSILEQPSLSLLAGWQAGR